DISASPLHVLSEELWRVKRSIDLAEIPKRAIAFCGIARPHQFFGNLRELGVELADTVGYPDHHSYNRGDVANLLRIKDKLGVDAFITTEKDSINLGELAHRLAPFYVAQLRVTVQRPEQVLETLLGVLEKRCGCRFPPRT